MSSSVKRRRWPYLWVSHGEDERRARLGRLLALVVGPRVRAVCGCVGTRGREGVG